MGNNLNSANDDDDDGDINLNTYFVYFNRENDFNRYEFHNNRLSKSQRSKSMQYITKLKIFKTIQIQYCDTEQLIYILKNQIFAANSILNEENKQKTIEYFRINNIDGKTFKNLGKQKFAESMVQFTGNKSIIDPLMKIYSDFIELSSIKWAVFTTIKNKHKPTFEKWKKLNDNEPPVGYWEILNDNDEKLRLQLIFELLQYYSTNINVSSNTSLQAKFSKIWKQDTDESPIKQVFCSNTTKANYSMILDKNILFMFDSIEYRLTWWNQQSKNKVNAIGITNKAKNINIQKSTDIEKIYLRFKSLQCCFENNESDNVNKSPTIRTGWQWWNNNHNRYSMYDIDDDKLMDQLYASYLSNIDGNFDVIEFNKFRLYKCSLSALKNNLSNKNVEHGVADMYIFHATKVGKYVMNMEQISVRYNSGGYPFQRTICLMIDGKAWIRYVWSMLINGYIRVIGNNIEFQIIPNEVIELIKQVYFSIEIYG
eukprot:178328_1